MKQKKIRRFLLLIPILMILFIITTTVWAETESEFIIMDPCEGFEALPGAQIYCGEHKGSGYRIEVPDNWNGDLLLWAHGYRGLFSNEYLYVDDPPFRGSLIENGFAWAASSFSANFTDITVGVKDTKTLLKFFKKEIAKPNRVFISGESMGGGIAVTSVEQWPNLYDGAMPTCGTLDQYVENDSLWDYYVLINALAGKEASYPVPEDFVTSGAYAAILDEFVDESGTFPLNLNEKGEQLKNAVMMATGGERSLFDTGFLNYYGFWDTVMPPRVSGLIGESDLTGVKGDSLDNWETIYQLDTDLALSPEEENLNDTIFRIQRDPQSMHPNGLKNVPVNNGDIRVPILSIHGIADLLAPFHLEQIYAQRVAEHGASDFLVQRAIRDFQHCWFTEEEYTTAFLDLVNWVETGEKPEGDDILDPIVVADPDYGCQFTSTFGHDWTWYDPLLFIPPCP